MGVLTIFQLRIVIKLKFFAKNRKLYIKNKNKVQTMENQYVYDNDKIINKIIKIIDENKKHPDRISKIL